VRPWLLAAALACWSCDHGLDAGPPGQSGIAGRLVFRGEWPPEAEEVAVAVYERTPRQVEELYALSGWDTGVEVGAGRHDYFVPIERDGTYRWVIVAWRPKGSFWDFRSLLGCYHAAGDSLPTPVTVVLGQVTGGIDIEVDFGVLRGEEVPGYNLCVGALPGELLDQAGGG
jgi:hypothetical protein